MRTSPALSTIIVIAYGLLPVFAQTNKAEIDTHIRKAREAIARHDLRGASDEYAVVLKLDPGNVEINVALGIALYALGRPAEAVKSLRAVMAANPTRADAEAFLGLSLADLSQCRDALPLLRKQFNLQSDPKVGRLVGLALLGCSGAGPNSDDAIDIARRLKRSYPDDPDVLYQVAELYSALSKNTVNDLLKKRPDSFRVHELAGEALEAEHNDVRALLEYRKAIELNPKAPHLHYRIATILLRDQKNATDEQAREEFTQELTVNPGDAPSEYQIGEILRRQNQLDGASVHFARALELDPAFVEAHIGVAQLEMARHQFNAAITHLQTAVRLAPENPNTHYSLMLAYRESGKVDEAKREMATVEDLNAKKESDFNQSLRTLLTGHPDQP